jgi:hypothetical protein
MRERRPLPGGEQAADPVPGSTIAQVLRFCAHFTWKVLKLAPSVCLK